MSEVSKYLDIYENILWSMVVRWNMAKEGSYSDHHFPVLLYSNGEDNRLLTEDQALVFMIANNVSDLDIREVSTHIYFIYNRYILYWLTNHRMIWCCDDKFTLEFLRKTKLARLIDLPSYCEWKRKDNTWFFFWNTSNLFASKMYVWFLTTTTR